MKGYGVFRSNIWFDSILCNRKMKVILNSHSSRSFGINTGLPHPQGSTLESTLFLIFYQHFQCRRFSTWYLCWWQSFTPHLNGKSVFDKVKLITDLQITFNLFLTIFSFYSWILNIKFKSIKACIIPESFVQNRKRKLIIQSNVQIYCKAMFQELTDFANRK